jgi:hypothetical protein
MIRISVRIIPPRDFMLPREDDSFWDVAPCSLVEAGRRIRGVYCLFYQGEYGTLYLNIYFMLTELCGRVVSTSTSYSGGPRNFCFVFGRSRVQVLLRIPDILTGLLWFSFVAAAIYRILL